MLSRTRWRPSSRTRPIRRSETRDRRRQHRPGLRPAQALEDRDERWARRDEPAVEARRRRLTVVPRFSSSSGQLLEYSGLRDVHQVDERSAIAPASLRSHTKAIYRKLDGSSRDEVFERARELGRSRPARQSAGGGAPAFGCPSHHLPTRTSPGGNRAAGEDIPSRAPEDAAASDDTVEPDIPRRQAGRPGTPPLEERI